MLGRPCGGGLDFIKKISDKIGKTLIFKPKRRTKKVEEYIEVVVKN